MESTRKREREKARSQRRRMQMKPSNADEGEPPPLFQPIERSNTSDDIQKIAKHLLGDYTHFQTTLHSMDGNEQRKLLGVVDTTPSTPILPGKQNPFDSEYRKFDGSSSLHSSFTTTTTSSSSSGSGRGGAEKSGSRHPIAEPPPAAGSNTSREKKREMDKDRQHSKKGDRAKASSASKPHGVPHAAGSSAAEKGGPADPTTNLKPTNILVVPKPKKTVKTPRLVPSSPTASSHSASGAAVTPLSATSKSKQPSHPLGDLFKVDSQQQQGGTGSSGHSVASSSSHTKPLKQKKSRTKTQQQVPPTSSSHVSYSDSHPHPSSSASHKTSNTVIGSGTTTISSHGTVPRHKKSASVHPSVSTTASGGSKEYIDTKVVFPLMKVKSTGDGAIKVTPQPQSFHPSHVKGDGSIDIAHLGQLSFKGTSHLETMEDTSQPTSAAPVEKLNRKKEKKLRKKQKRDRDKEKMDTSESPLPTATRTTNDTEAFAQVAPLPSRVPPADSHVVPSYISHMTASHTYEGTPTSLKVHIPKPRPSELKITGSSEGTEVFHFSSCETLVDSSRDINVLEELMRPLPSLVTPISTPKKTKPFFFPQPPSDLSRSSLKAPNPLAEKYHGASTEIYPHLHHTTLLGSTSSEESDGERKEAIDAAMSTLNSVLESERPERVPPHEMDLSSGSSSSSDSSSDSSSSSSSSSEDEDDENEENEGETISPALAKLDVVMRPRLNTITPLKKTPPHTIVISPLADEAANMSPPKPSTLPQLLYEHPSRSTPAEPALLQHDVDESESSSSSDSDDSGSESDSESSDSEDASSTTEDATAKARAAAPTNFMSATTQDDEASSELTFLGQSTNSTGFGDGIISGATSALWSRDVFPELTSDVSQSTRASFGFIPLSQHVLPEDSDVSKVKRPPSPKQRKDSSREDTHGKKRKHEPESQPVARKAPKAMNTKGADTKSTLHRGETGAQKGPQKRKSLRRDSSLSSFSVSESDNSDDGSSSSSEEEEEGGDAFMDTSVPSKPHPEPTLTNKMEDSSVLSQHHPHRLHQYPHQQQQQSDGGGMVSGGQPLGALVVRIPLMLVQNQQLHKPKATVAPTVVNPPSKAPGRRLTMDATEHEAAHPSRRMSHSDRERDVYSRHREGLDHRGHSQLYADDYRRGRDGDRSRSREGSRGWDSTHNRRHLSGSDQDLPPRGRSQGGNSARGGEGREYRGPSWERDRNYHSGGGGGGCSGRGTDDYWSDYGNYGRRRRQRGYHHGQERNYGAQHYLQEARRRKHEADKIEVRGVEKAKAYMESVTYFMRYGDAIEHEPPQQQWDANHSNNPFRMYSDTIHIIKHCQNIAGECKPLLVLCSRCQSVLYWKLYLLKQTAASRIQKELQEFFVSPKGTQRSPYPSSFSPLPSPASVSSTGSGCSGGGASQDTSPSATVSVPKHIFNKATEHLNITTFLTQSFELWKYSDVMLDQCREFFASNRARRVNQYSPIPDIAEWTDQSLRNLLHWV